MKKLTFADILIFTMLIMLAFAYPVTWMVFAGKSRFWGDLQLFDLNVFTLFFAAAAMLLPGRINKALGGESLAEKLPLLLALLLPLMVAIQGILYGFRWDAVLRGCFIPAAFCAGYALNTEAKKILPPALGFGGIMLLIFSIVTDHCYGFVGNWNWNYTITVLAIIPLVHFFVRGKFFIPAATAAILLFIGLMMIPFPETFPRGTLLSLVLAGAVLPLASVIPEKRSTLIWSALITAGLVAFTVLAVSLIHFNDYRIQLWSGTLDLISDYPWAGCGSWYFEDLIAEKLPELYHFCRFRAERHTHPHNELYFMMTGYGTAGVIFLISAVSAAMKQVRQKDFNSRYLLFALLVLFFHGQLDVLLGEVHTGVIFYFLLGVLCGTPGEVSGSKTSCTGGVVLLIAAAVQSVMLVYSTFHYRMAKLELKTSPETAMKHLQISCEVKPSAQNLYLAGVASFNCGDSRKAAEYWQRLHRETGFTGYVHSNGLLARSLVLQGDFAGASEYFAREASRFPLSIINTSCHLAALQACNAPESIIAQEKAKLQLLLKMRGLTPDCLPMILSDPGLDDTLPVRKVE